jgi:hypothetical protein
MDPCQGLLQLGWGIILEYLGKDDAAAGKGDQDAGNGNKGTDRFRVQKKNGDKDAGCQRGKKSDPD